MWVQWIDEILIPYLSAMAFLHVGSYFDPSTSFSSFLPESSSLGSASTFSLGIVVLEGAVFGSDGVSLGVLSASSELCDVWSAIN